MKKYLFLFLPMLALADDKITYKFVVDSPTMVEAYSNIFNAMAAFFQSPEYLEILKIVFLLGGLFTFCIGVIKTYQGGAGTAPLMDFAKYMIAGVIMLTLMFSQPANLSVVTNKITPLCNQTMANATVTSPGSGDSTRTGDVIANIPLALAWSFSFINELGRNTTRLAVTAFSSETVDLTSYSDASQFASYLSSTSTLLSTKLIDLISDTNAQGSKINLLAALDAIQSDCVLIPGSKSSLGNEMIHAFTVTGDLYQTMDDIFTTDTLNIYRYPYTPKKASNVNTPGGTGGGTTTPSGLGKNNLVSTLPGYTFGEPKGGAMEPGLAPKDALVDLNGEVMRCGDLWKIVGPELQKLRDSRAVECRSGLRRTLNGSTISVLTGNNSKDDNTTVLSAARQIGIQAGLMNHFMEAKGKILPGELNYATGKSIGDFVTSSLGTGYYMAKMLPYLQMGMRAILYAFFPFVFIVVLLPGGFKNLFQYAQTLIWIELWSPTAAILNMFLSLQTADSLQTLYNVKGLNMSNSLQVFSDATQMASIAGYLYASVPALTWLILKGSGYMLGNITNGVAAKMAANMDSRSINQDMKDLEETRAINRNNKTGETISLAEKDLKTAQFMAATDAGSFLGKDQLGRGAVMRASKGQTLNQIATGVGQNAALDKNYVNQRAVSAGQQKNIEQMKQEMIAKGELNENGEFNDKTMEANARTLAREMNIDLQTARALQSHLADLERVEGKVDKGLAEHGANMGTREATARFLEMIGEKDLAKQVRERGSKALVEGSKTMSVIGQWGAGFNAAKNDAYAQAMDSAGVRPKDMGYFKHGQDVSAYKTETEARLNTITSSKYGRDVAQVGYEKTMNLNVAGINREEALSALKKTIGNEAYNKFVDAAGGEAALMNKVSLSNKDFTDKIFNTLGDNANQINSFLSNHGDVGRANLAVNTAGMVSKANEINQMLSQHLSNEELSKIAGGNLPRYLSRGILAGRISMANTMAIKGGALQFTGMSETESYQKIDTAEQVIGLFNKGAVTLKLLGVGAQKSDIKAITDAAASGNWDKLSSRQKNMFNNLVDRFQNGGI